MSDVSSKVHMEFEVGPELVSSALSALASYVESHGLPKATGHAAELALDELLANCLMHGELDPAKGLVLLDLDVQDGYLQITVSDNGIAFDPLSLPEPDLDSPLEERRAGGVGIHLVKNFVDSFSYQRVGDKNIVSLRCKVRTDYAID